MAKRWRQANVTSKTERIFIQSSIVSDGSGLTGLTNGSSGLKGYYIREGASADVAISIVSATLGTWTSGGFVVVDGTNMPGLYEVSIPNAAYSTGANSVTIMYSGATNMVPALLEVEITAVDNTSTGFGLSNASANVVQVNGAAASAGVAQLGINVVNWNGTVVSAPATAGIPDVNVKNYNNQTAATDANNLPKVDAEDIKGAVISTGVSQLGVNLVNISGSAVATGTAQLGVNVVNISGAAVSTGVAQVGTNSVNWAGGAIPSPNVTGVPKVDLVDILGAATSTGVAQLGVNLVNISGSSVNTSSAQIGTNLVNISGSAVTTGVAQLGVNTVKYNNQTAVTDGNNYPSVNIVDIAGATLSTGLAQLGVNTVKYNNQTAQTDVNNLPKVDIEDVKGAVISTGVAQFGVNEVSINNVSTSSVTTVNANIGETQPINFTGTGASALVKTDVIDIGGAAVTAGLAQIGVNVVKYNNQTAVTDGNNYPSINVVDINGAAASTGVSQLGVNLVNIKGSSSVGAAGYVAPDWSAINAPTTTVNLSGTTIAAVSGAVGSVTAIVTANTTQIAGSSVTTGIAQIGVNAVNIGGQAAQLDGNNLLKVDVVDINGSAASTGVAQLGVNAVQIGGVVPGSATIGTVTNVTNAVGITSNRKKGVQSTFEFLMQKSSDGSPATGLTVAATISKDGGAPGASANAVTEIGLGQYQIVLTASEMNANNIFTQFTAATAVTSNLSIQTAP